MMRPEVLETILKYDHTEAAGVAGSLSQLGEGAVGQVDFQDETRSLGNHSEELEDGADDLEVAGDLDKNVEQQTYV